MTTATSDPTGENILIVSCSRIEGFFLAPFVAHDGDDFTYGADDRVRSLFGHAMSAVGYEQLASAT